jgi:CBS domain-containing protein
MKARDVMTSSVETVEPQATIDEIARRMRDCDCGCVLVQENDHLVGVVTDRDITVRSVAESLDPLLTTARHVMSEGVLYCFEDEDAEHVCRNMGENAVRRLPVLNHDKRLVGIISLGDLSIAANTKTTAGETMEKIRLAS